MEISSDFDGGNIAVLSSDDASDIRLEIRPDHNSDFYQWFHYRLSGAAGEACTMYIVNAAGAAFTDGWKDYRAVASYDRETWFRVETSYDREALEIRHTPEEDNVWYAYFAPFCMDRHASLIARAKTSKLVSHRVLGKTLDGQDIDLLEVGDGELHFWLIARQHPGETMAEWWMEGFLESLLFEDDMAAKLLLMQCRLHIVPNMNPDGSRRGHLRTNAAGANLNREWHEPSMERSPEVALVRDAMHESGVDFCFDVHGDEALPYNFVAAFEGIPSLNPRQIELLELFKTALLKHSPDFQTRYGYPPTRPGEAKLTMCTNYVAETFGCLAMTLEMPFKDNADRPNAEFGWSPVRCRELGSACLDALNDIAPEIAG